MHETEFPTSKLIIVLGLSLVVCSCVKLPHQVTSIGMAATSSPIRSKTDASRINLNTASARDLEALPGVGKILAERILAHRSQYGPFRRAEHLMMVRGFSDHKFRAIRECITVE